MEKVMKLRLRNKPNETKCKVCFNFTLYPIILLDKDANNLAFDRTAAHLISKAQLLAINYEAVWRVAA